MRHLVIKGSYGECLPSGEFAVLVPGVGVQTHLGLFALDPREKGLGPLYLRITNLPKFQFAGQSATLKGKSWLWDGKWNLLDNGAYGVSGLIFRGPTLLFSDRSKGSQGFRYVREGGTPVTGDQTYHSKELDLWEYSTLRGVTVGQGEHDAVVLYQGMRKTLVPGEARFIRLNVSPNTDTIAVSVTQFAAGVCHLFWLSRSEIAGLPDYRPVPIPTPPSPEPTVALPDKKTALAAVTEARQKYASFSGRLRAYLIVNYVAWKLKEFGAGVYSKGQSGDGYDPPNDGVKEIISSDAIIFKPNWETFDCLNDAEGKADPAWNRTTPTGFGKEQNWRSPVDPRPFNDGPAPEPEPQPTPVTVIVSSFSASTKDGKIVLTYTV